MTPVEIIGLVQTTVLIGIFFRLGGHGERLKALEKWRDDFARVPNKSSA